MSRVRYFHWDFPGADGEETARHFERHVQAFLAREGLSGCETGIEPDPPAGYTAFCAAPEPAWDAVIRGLRPHWERPEHSPD
jgi:hypothetical protein